MKSKIIKDNAVIDDLKEIENILEQKPKIYEGIKLHSLNAERLLAASKKVSKNDDSIGIEVSLLIISFEEVVKARWLLNYILLEPLLPLIKINKNLSLDGPRKKSYSFLGELKNNSSILLGCNSKKLKKHQNKLDFMYSELNLLHQFAMLDIENFFEELLSELNETKNKLKNCDISGMDNPVKIIINDSLKTQLKTIEKLEEFSLYIKPLFIKIQNIYKKSLVEFFEKADIKEIKNFDKIRTDGFYCENPDFDYYKFREKWQPIVEGLIKGLLKFLDDKKNNVYFENQKTEI